MRQVSSWSWLISFGEHINPIAAKNMNIGDGFQQVHLIAVLAATSVAVHCDAV